MKTMAERDALTGIYNRANFLKETRLLIDRHPETVYVLIRININRFRLYNAFFGLEKGNALLRTMGNLLAHLSRTEAYTYGRMESDIFCLCEPCDKKRVREHIEGLQQSIDNISPNYCIELSFGAYIIDERDIDVEMMYARAATAARKIAENPANHFSLYDQSMSDQIYQQQLIMNDMQAAIDREEFIVYVQPKYNLIDGLPFGGEALVRWDHPGKGLISPGQFIPVFEQNGFIAKLDRYMWEKVCQMLHKWIEQGHDPAPISVNMSRVSLNNPHLVDVFNDLVTKYNVPPELMHLELTESAYMDNPVLMKQTIWELHEAGFVILMDDFGSGYSSLNTLKDINVDILKIDMKFLPTGEDDTRSEKILASVIRMAGWLGMPVVVEGVETTDQIQFLQGVGCGYVQGYYFAKPMPETDYEQLIKESGKSNPLTGFSNEELEEINGVWSATPQVEAILRGISIPLAMVEYTQGDYQIIRVNKAFHQEFPSKASEGIMGESFGHNLPQESVCQLNAAFADAVCKKGTSECEYSRGDTGTPKWYHAKIQYLQSLMDASLLCVVINDISNEKILEKGLRQIQNTVLKDLNHRKRMLIVDDTAVGRKILTSFFAEDYEIVEAENGSIALEWLKKEKGDVDIILLDMMMPVMKGDVFLDHKNADPELADIPVVMISSEQDSKIQTEMLQKGVSDYITKPFVAEVTKRRVDHVIEYNSRFQGMVREYKKLKQQLEEH